MDFLDWFKHKDVQLQFEQFNKEYEDKTDSIQSLMNEQTVQMKRYIDHCHSKILELESEVIHLRRQRNHMLRVIKDFQDENNAPELNELLETTDTSSDEEE
jgi:hypothetical protein